MNQGLLVRKSFHSLDPGRLAAISALRTRHDIEQLTPLRTRPPT